MWIQGLLDWLVYTKLISESVFHETWLPKRVEEEQNCQKPTDSTMLVETLSLEWDPEDKTKRRRYQSCEQNLKIDSWCDLDVPGSVKGWTYRKHVGWVRLVNYNVNQGRWEQKVKGMRRVNRGKHERRIRGDRRERQSKHSMCDWPDLTQFSPDLRSSVGDERNQCS